MTFNLTDFKDELILHEQDIIKEIIEVWEVDKEKYRGSKKLVKMIIKINGERANIFVGFKDSYPSSLPLFFDLDNAFGTIPHKEKDGFLCFTNSNAIVIDKRYPVSLFLNCVEKVVDLIEAGLNGENTSDFKSEFEAYWRHIAKGKLHAAIDTDNRNIREIDLWMGKENNPILIASEKGLKNVNEIIKTIFHFDINQQRKYRCVYIPLKDSSILPPTESKEWDYSHVKNIFKNNLSKRARQKFQKIIKKKDKSIRYGKEFVIFSLALSNGNTALFAYFMEGTNYSYLHPLIQKPNNLELIPLALERWHPKYLLNRTNGNTKLINKHIAVIGVGSVGSEIAVRFAKSGVQHLTLIDNDVLELENVYRHALGNNQVYKKNKKKQLKNVPKVIALKNEIEIKYPFTKVTPIPQDINDVLKNGSLDLKNIDIVVVAIGSANQEMDINEKMHSLKQPPPTIFAWNEPLGIGGHVLITLNQESTGCYQCLFKPIDDKPIHNRSSFAKPGQDFSKDLTGCGSLYVPYSFIDSEKTALLTVENTMKLLNGELQDNPLLSWKGDAKQLKSEGFETSYRFSLDSQKLYNSRLLYKDEKCPICSGKG